MKKKVFITGITGFVGSHLARHLLKLGFTDISGTYLLENSLNQIINFKNSLNLFQADLRDTGKVYKILSDLKPDLIYHLAALTSPADSFKDPIGTINNNVAAQINILESVRKLGLQDALILVVSSADVYGLVSKNNLPIDEQTPFRPTNPYAVSKITQDYLGLQYYLSYKLNIIRVRPFNHIGEGQSDNFVVSSFAKKIAQIEKGHLEPIMKVGNLTTKRDFTDVSDIVDGYILLTRKGKSGEVYNIGSGVSYAISEILDKLFSFSKIKIELRQDPDLFRPADNPDLVCDCKKLKLLTGWEPKIPIEQTLRQTLDYWRNIV